MSTGTLDQFAAGLDQANRDLQRQTLSYGYLRAQVARLREVSQLPPREQLTEEQHHDLEHNLRLLTMMFRQPPAAEGQQEPDIIEYDLNAAPRHVQAAIIPLLEAIQHDVGTKLVQDWEAVNNINGQAQRILHHAQGQQQPPPQAPTNGAGQQQAPGAPAQQPAGTQPQMGLPPRPAQ